MADFHDDGVEEDDGVDGIEGAVLPGLDLLDDGVGGVGDQGGGDLHLVDLKQVLLDLAHAQAARVEADDRFVEAVELAPVLGDEGGLEVAVAVAGDFDGDLAVVAAQGFGAVAVAGVGRASGGAFRRAPVLVVAEMGGQLGVEDAVDEAFLEFGEQSVGAKQVAGLAVVLEELVEEGVSNGLFHWDVLVLLIGHINGKHLHKIYDTPRTGQPRTRTYSPRTRTDGLRTLTDGLSTRTDEPATRTDEPSTRTDEPFTRTDQPSTRTDEPRTRTDEPFTRTDEPSTRTDQTSTRTDEPSICTDEHLIRTDEPRESGLPDS